MRIAIAVSISTCDVAFSGNDFNSTRSPAFFLIEMNVGKFFGERPGLVPPNGLKVYLLVLDRQVEGNGPVDALFAVAVVAEEAKEDVDEGDSGHSLVQDSADAEEVRRRFHVVLQGHHLKTKEKIPGN